MADSDEEAKRIEKLWKRIASRVRMVGSSNNSERRMAFATLEQLMHDEKITWSDIGNAAEFYGKYSAKGGELFTEAELQEYAQTLRAEAVEAGIGIGMARGKSPGNGYLSLPQPCEMAEFCHDQSGRLKDDKQRQFITDMLLMTQRGMRLSLLRLGYLASIYIQIGGKT